MRSLPPSVADFLTGTRIVVAGVSRSGHAPAHAILRRLRECEYDVIPLKERRFHPRPTGSGNSRAVSLSGSKRR